MLRLEPLNQPRTFGFHRPSSQPSALPTLAPTSRQPNKVVSFAKEAPCYESYVTDELSKLAINLNTQLGSVKKIVTLCRRTQGRHELQQLPLDAHPAAALLNSMRTEGGAVHLSVAQTA